MALFLDGTTVTTSGCLVGSVLNHTQDAEICESIMECMENLEEKGEQMLPRKSSDKRGRSL